MGVKRRAMVSMPAKRADVPDLRPSRRRRFAAYSLAFACMLALSLLLDLRRAAERRRTPKLQLTLPSRTSLQSLADEPLAGADATGATEGAPVTTVETPAKVPSPLPPARSDASDSPLLSAVDAEQLPRLENANPNPNLSDQELKDDVDQLIAHVDQEEAIEASQVVNSTTATNASVADASVSSDVVANVSDSSSMPKPMPVNASEIDVRLNSQQYFDDAQARLARMLADSHTKTLIDENELRTLQALQLQATRGDCESASDRDATLFKTDAEAASNLDIERSDPLWGAWCLFLGSYKTDAMRDFVTKQQVLEHRVAALREQVPLSNATDARAEFDANAASLDDVMTPEQQSSLRANIDRILSHLKDIDIRYLAALSLQATFGDCAPYVPKTESEDGSEPVLQELRVLKEPLLDQTAARRDGAQWGAWCVLQGKKRSTAASQLMQRVDMLIDQLSKSEAEASESSTDQVNAEARDRKKDDAEEVVASAS